MYCPKCGTELKEGVKFCNKCGNEVKQVQQPIPVVRPAPQPTPVPRVQPAPQPTPVTRVQPVPQPTPVPLVPQKKKKSKLPIIIGCIAVVFVIAVIGSVYIINNSEDSKADYSGAVINANSSNYEEDIVADDAESEAVVDDIVEHTIMIYMVGSDLETVNGMGSSDIQEIFNADYGDNTRVILQTGGCLDWKIESMADGQVQRFELTDTELIELDSLGQISMLKADTLADFITFASTVSPAEKYSLVMWNHGGGVPIGFGKDEIFPNDKLYDYQIGEALEHAGVYFECVTFDACNMCTLEVAMAIKDYAKYMVAAESRIPGCGMDYTTWLNCYGEDNIDYLASYEVLTSAYMDSLQTVGSISLINLGKIQAVYDAYTQYIQSVHEAVLNGAYEEYTIARSQCGLYECTESVDLVTLATLYPTDASANLINSIVNAVYYTESDYAYGHGLAAYNPIS